MKPNEIISELVQHFQAKAADSGDTLFASIDKFLKNKVQDDKEKAAAARAKALGEQITEVLRPGLNEFTESRKDRTLENAFKESAAERAKRRKPREFMSETELQQEIDMKFDQGPRPEREPATVEPYKRVIDKTGIITPQIEFNYGGPKGPKINLVKAMAEIKELESMVNDIDDEGDGDLQGSEATNKQGSQCVDNKNTLMRPDGSVAYLYQKGDGTFSIDYIVEVDGTVTRIRKSA